MNFAAVSGVLKGDFQFDHVCGSEKFYKGHILTERRSGIYDVVPVLISEILIKDLAIGSNEYAEITGEYRTKNKDGHLVQYLFAKSIYLTQRGIEDINSLELEGYICKMGGYRTTPSGREICDFSLAVNRERFRKSDYIPCIAWGRNALLLSNMQVGDKLRFIGRMQSREYEKIVDGEIVKKSANEVSAWKINMEDEA